MAFKDQKQSEPLQVSVPTEIILEILFRLPVVSLLRCKCVCKLWFSFISDPYFINRHAKNNESSHRLGRLLLITPETPINIKTCQLCDVLHDEAVNALEIDYPFKDKIKYVSVAGSCSGLLCLRFWVDHINTYCIWNPSTRRSSKRFSPCGKRSLVSGFGFGYDKSTDDYKVVELCRLHKNGTPSDNLTAHMYSLKSKNRKNFSLFPQGRLHVEGNGTFLNGALHWLGGKYITDGHWRSVVSFDLATESYGEISAPPYDGKSDTLLKLGVLGEWLCVVRTYMEKHGDVWVMKEYGVTTSWVKVFSIPYLERRWGSIFSAPLCISDDGKVLVQFGSTLVLYDPKSRSVSEIRSFEKWCNAITFVESLVSPDS